MNAIRTVVAWSTAAVVVVAMSACFWHRTQSEDDEADSCPAPAESETWKTWRTEKMSDVSLEIPTTFVEHNSPDARTRTWRDGPREIAVRLTSDAHATRRVQHLVAYCEMEVGDRMVEVAETRPEGSTRELLALVTGVPGGPNLLVRVSTPYFNEFDALRRAVSSIHVDGGK